MKGLLGGVARAEYGCIVTAREQESGRLWVAHFAGKGALERVASWLDSLPEVWKLLSYSTPETIFRDLQGTRDDGEKVQLPERSALGRLGRLDLLDPSLAPQLPRGRTHW